MAAHEPRPLRARRLLLGAGGAYLAAVVGWQAALPAEAMTPLFMGAAKALAACMAAILCLQAAPPGAPHRRSWLLLGWAALSWSFGALAQGFLSLRGMEAPPSYADLFYLLAYPLGASALLPFAHPMRAGRWRTLLDALFIASSLLFLTRALALGPGRQIPAGATLAQGLAIAYPFGDIVILSLGILVAARAVGNLRILGAAIALAALAVACADLLAWKALESGAFRPGPMAQAGWVAGFLALGYAALHPPRARELHATPASVASALVPLVPFLAATAASFYVEIRVGYLEPFLFWNAIAVILLLTCRQVLAVAENVALRTQADSLLEENREAHRQHTLLLNSVTHDLMGPLSPLRLHVRMLENAPPDPHTAKAVQVMSRSLAQVNRLAQDLKDLANLEAGHLRVEPAPHDLAPALAATVACFGESAREAGVLLRPDIPSHLEAWADPGRIGQVLDNLVANALRFSPRGATLRVAARAGPDRVRVEVTDAGRGLAPGESARLFQPFSQLKAAGDKGGTGLGLYMSRIIVERHGGSIGVESAGPGKGATFWFELPVRPPGPAGFTGASTDEAGAVAVNT